MTQEELQTIIIRERTVLLSHKDKFKSRYFNQRCEDGLKKLNAAERFSREPEPNWGMVRILLKLALADREAVEEAVSQFGYDMLISHAR